MGSSCQCGMEVAYQFHHLGCIDCGSACCPSCAIQLESATYCRSCAGSLLGVPAVRSQGPFDLQ